MKTFLHILLAFTLVLGTAVSDSPPIDDKTIEELAKDANKSFESEAYCDALDKYEKLVSLEPGNFNYRYRYGACLLYGSGKKELAMKYIQEAAGKDGVEMLAYFYMGKALHLNFRFSEAVTYYEKFKNYGNSKDKERLKIDEHINMAKNGKKLLSDITDIVVLEKKTGSIDNFYSYYRLDNIGGNVVNAKGLDELRFKKDKKNDQDIIMHIPDKALTDKVFYASYGDNGDNKDIYMVKRLPNGEWGIPQIVRGGVNTKMDEDYPFMHPNGKHLYFASKGHNSMGGYDVFRSTLNPDGTFSSPENIDFAINSPDDDILYIVDSLDQYAYFASNRESSCDKYHIYKVKVQRYPIQLAIIKGKYENKINPNKKGVSITVKDGINDEVKGVFNSDANGGYLITLPRAGKYKFVVKTDNSETIHEVVVPVPATETIRALPQDMTLVKQDREVLQINNRFGEMLEDNELIVASILKDKSLLNPNEEEFKDVDPVGDSSDSVDTSLPAIGDMTDADIIVMAEKDEAELKENLEEAEDKKDAAYAVAGNYYKKAEEQSTQAQEAIKQAQNASSPEEKQQYEEMAERLLNESRSNAQKATTAYNMAQRYDEEVKNLREDYDVAKKFTTGIKDAIDGNDRATTERQLREQQEFILNVMAKNDAEAKQREIDELEQELQGANQSVERAESIVQSLKDDKAALASEIAVLESELENAKKKDKPAIQEKIEQKRNELASYDGEIAIANDRLKESKNTKNSIETQLDLALGNFGNVNAKPLTEQELVSLQNKISNNDLEKQLEQQDNDLAQTRSVEASTASSAGGVTDVVANDPKYSELVENPNNSIPSDKSELESLISEDESWVGILDQDINQAKDQLSNTSDPDEKANLEKKIAGLEELKDQKENTLAQRRSALEDMDSGTSALTTASLDPDYKSEYASTESIQNPVDKAKKRNELDQNLISQVDSEIATTRSAMEEGSISEAEGNTKISQLEDIKSDAESRINENDQLIAASNGGATSESQVNYENPINLETVAPELTDTRANLLANNAGDTESTKSLMNVNNSLLEELDNALKSIDESEENGDISSATARERRSEVLELKQDLEDQNVQLSEQLADAGTTSTTSYTEPINLNDLVSNFNERKSSLNEEDLTPKERAEKSMALNSELINSAEDSKRDIEEKRASGELSDDVAQARTEELNQIIASAQSENDDSQRVMNSATETIAVSDMAPNYEEDYAAVKRSNLTPVEQARQLNALNEDLIAKIDSKIDETNQRVKDGNLTEEQASIIIGDLEEIRDQKQQDIAANRALIDSESVSYSDPQLKFESDEAKESYESTAGSREKISEYENEIANLQEQLNAAESEKDKKKIEKKIDKAEKKKVKEEIKIGEELGESNNAEFNNVASNTAARKDAVDSNGKASSSNPDFVKAQSLDNEADQLFANAQAKRAEAKSERDKDKKNELLKEAFDDEQRAIKKKSESEEIYNQMLDDFYVAGSIEDPTVGLELTEISSDPEKRKSAEYYSAADMYYAEAQDRDRQAAEKRAEAETASKKDAEALKEEATKLDEEADELRERAARAEKRGDTAAQLENEATLAEKKANAPKDLSDSEEQQVRSMEEYIKFYEMMLDAIEIKSKRENKVAQKEKVREELVDLKRQRDDLKTELATTSEDSKPQIEAAILELETEIATKETELADLRSEVSDLVNEEDALQRDIDNYLESIQDDRAEMITALTGRDGSNLLEPIETRAVDPTNADFKVPDQLAGSIFKKSDQPVYNDDNPIPVNAQNPKGLVYKVQVGAFRNPIPQDLFKDFAPISGERLDNGITRYMVGYFDRFTTANEAKTQIRGFGGYEGAFVVAYIDGERVSIAQALAYEQQNPPTGPATDVAINNGNNGGAENTNQNGNNGQEANTNQGDLTNNGDQGENNGGNTNTAENPNTTETPVNTTTSDGTTISYQEDPEMRNRLEQFGDAAEALQGSNIKGLYFTVQVGAFSRPIKKGALNIDPLVYFEINNLWKYTTGVYKSVEAASVRKDEIRNSGIVPDAFVTAFYDGNKIAVAEAQQLIAEKGESILTGNQATQPESQVDIDYDNVEVDALTYYVFLGKYQGTAPTDFSGIMLNNSDKVQSEEDEDFATVYRTKKVDNYKEALRLQDYFKAEGIEGARIQAEYQFDKISLEEAENLRRGGQSASENTPEDVTPTETIPEDTTSEDTTPEDNTSEDRGFGEDDSSEEEDDLFTFEEDNEARLPKPVEGLTYRLVLGVFDGTVPESFSRVALDNSDRGVQSEENDSFETVYFVGSFDTFARALLEKDYFEGEGLSDTSIEAFYNFEKIDIEEAKRMTNED